MKKRLGEILLERGLIDAAQLNAALGHQRQWGMRLGTALVAKGFVPEGTLTRVLAESLNIPMVDLAKMIVDQKALQLVPRRVCEQHEVFPIALKDQPKGRRLLLLAMVDPLNAAAIDEIGFTTDTIVKPAIAQISSVEQAIRRYYYGQRVDISPLSFEKRGTSGFLQSAEETMTIIGGGGGDERVIDGRGKEVLNLTEEVTERTALAEVRRGMAAAAALEAAQLGELPPFMATQPPAEYTGQPTGTFTMPAYTEEGAAVDDAVVSVARAADNEDLQALEKKFWALMRVLARRGLVTKEEFLSELRAAED